MKDFLLELENIEVQEQLNIIKKEVNRFANKFPLYD